MDGPGGGMPTPPLALYALRFANSLTVLSALKFVNSPGGVAFDNTSVVVIENSVFR